MVTTSTLLRPPPRQSVRLRHRGRACSRDRISDPRRELLVLPVLVVASFVALL
jgi:hypothetical protein